MCTILYTKPKYDLFITEITLTVCLSLSPLPFLRSFRSSVYFLPSKNLQYDAFMQNFFHKNETNCCVHLFIRKMQQWDKNMARTTMEKMWKAIRSAWAVKGKRDHQQYSAQCKYTIPLLHLSSRKNWGRLRIQSSTIRCQYVKGSQTDWIDTNTHEQRIYVYCLCIVCCR